MRLAKSYAMVLIGIAESVASAQSLYSSATVGTTVPRTDTGLAVNSGTVGTMTASAAGQSDYGVLHASATASNTGGTDFRYAQGFSSFRDILTMTGGVGDGYFLADYTVDGTFAASGTAQVSANITWESLPNGVNGGLLAGTHTYAGVFAKKFTYGVAFGIGAQLFASVQFSGGGVGSGTADFSNTAILSAIHVVDAKGSPVAGTSISSSSGTVYPKSVPEPSSLIALSLGALALVRRRRR